jgi:2-iminobutanoate/2-iminopropanoate deaminase
MQRTTRTLISCAAILLALGSCEDATPPSAPKRVKQAYHLAGFEQNFGYAQAVLVDKTLYVSASVAVDGEGRLIGPGDMAAQIRAAYANIERTLSAHGTGFEAVANETIYTTDLDALLKQSAVRLEFYDKNQLPATSWVQVTRLTDPQFLVAISVIAELP